MSDVPTQYVVARVRDALAHDVRVAALDLQVRIVGSELFLTGMVRPEQSRRSESRIGVASPWPARSSVLLLDPTTVRGL